MPLYPQSYSIPDEPGRPFIDPDEIREILNKELNPPKDRIREVIDKSLSLERLNLNETAVLLNVRDQENTSLIFKAAGKLKEKVYGDRIVVFAPLYVGNRCINNCSYCGYKASNETARRQTLDPAQISEEVRALERTGQKRLILVFGEHPSYTPDFVADAVCNVYGTQKDNERINRVNINAAPLSVDGFRTVKQAGIGTYQIFQETYDPARYSEYHHSGPKKDFDNRLTALDRAMEAGIDDVGIGVLFGLADWKFEALALVRHTNHLEACFGTGPHTISIPRIKEAMGTRNDFPFRVTDSDFARLVAVLRLAVPYAGLILTAREPSGLRNELLSYGISQIDAGSDVTVGGYSRISGQDPNLSGQFSLNDERPLDHVVKELIASGNVPSFCTACYRKGRTGEHFMQFSTAGHIKKYCTVNSLITFAEYLMDYGDEETLDRGWELIYNKLDLHSKELASFDIAAVLQRIKNGERDILF